MKQQRIRRLDGSGVYPLSFEQERLWFLHQFNPNSLMHHLSRNCILDGPLDVRALRESFDEVVRRHEILRTTITLRGESAVQVVAPAQRGALPIVDLRSIPEEEKIDRVNQLALEQAREPFDMAKGPLMRAALLRLRDDENRLLLNLHHIITDWWSFGVLYRELSILYKSFLRGATSPLPELPIQYGDFARWQREWLQGAELEKLLSYWKKQLSGCTQLLNLPTDRPRPLTQTFQGRRLRFAFPKDLYLALEKLGHAEDVTAFVTSLAVFQVLLHRYTGQQDFLVGTPSANRSKLETEGLIGFLLNTLVLRGDLAGDPTFRELLRRLRETIVGAYGHQDLPFQKLVEEVQTERNLGAMPLVQVCFVFLSEQSPNLDAAIPQSSDPQFPGLTVRMTNVEISASEFDLTLSLENRPDFLDGFFEYNTELFDQTTISRMIGHLRTLMDAVVANPDQRISQLPLLTAEEKDSFLISSAGNTTAASTLQHVHQLFESQAEKNPEAIAVTFEKESVTYRELNERANKLAHYLIQLGVGPEMPVGILLERSVEMVVALLAVFKAGGVYVPLDPSHPAERWALMLEDTKAHFLLTQEKLAAHLPAREINLICVDTLREVITQQSNENPSNRLVADNLAYVIYTSGSTGQPKGVQITHNALSNFLNYMRQNPGLTPEDVFLAVATITFDISTLEIFLPLIMGARFVLVDRDTARDGTRLLSTIEQHGVTVVQATPGTWQLMLGAGWASRGALKILSGGEALPRRMAGELLRRSNSVWNVYGPTETTVWSHVARLAAEHETHLIGYPIAGAQASVLDKNLQPVPIGVAGEIYIGGAGVARGYVNSPALTAERFIPNPFSSQPGARWYRTGDLGRLGSDGNVEFLGRSDYQVKVRGMRIELGEIEAVLAQHEGVRQSVVVAREDVPGQRELVAYVVSTREPEVSASELRSYLREKLPEYMVPAFFVSLAELPLTPSRKVDRRALPAPERAESEQRFVAARTPVEELLVAIWRQVLQLEQIGIHDNFFHLGGHSLLVMQVASRLRQTFAVELPLRALFEFPTVAGLAQQVESSLRAGAGPEAPPLVRVRRQAGGLPLSFAQQRMWFIDQMQPAAAAYNISAAVRLSGALNVVALERSFTEIVRRHETLRTRFELLEGAAVQVIDEAAEVKLRQVDLRDREAVETEVAAEGQRPFDLRAGPLLRALLLQLGDEEHVLVVTMHHIVSDGWSMGIFIRELASLYSAYSGGNASPLAELPLQYADFAVWQREWLQGAVLEQQLQYWREQLGGRLPLLELPADRPRPARQSYRGSSYQFSLSPELSAGLKQLSHDAGVTLFMTLLAAFKSLLSRYTGQTDILVGTPIANRNRREVEGLIGFFVNTLVLRTELVAAKSFRQLLRLVRETALGAYAHQDVPFEKLVEELQPERDLSHTPLFQVMFVFHNMPPQQGLELPGLSLASLPVESGTAKFDLTLAMTEAYGGLGASFEYNTDLFETRTIERLAEHFKVLLQGIVADPDQFVGELPLLSEDERRQLLVEWNDTQVEYAAGETIHQLFEAQVARTPEAVALVFEEQQLTYRELNRRANRLAHELRRRGVGAERVVGLLLERSVEMVVAILGVLKAGGAYLPLDPAYPEERLRFMLADSGAELLVTESELVGQVGEVAAGLLCLDESWEASEENPAAAVGAENLAYMIYTSGSTGTPKAVLITHQAAHNLLEALKRRVYQEQVPAGCRVSLNASFTFDASVQQWLLLLEGATIHLIPQLLRADGPGLLKYLREQEVESFDCTPSQLRVLLSSGLLDGTGRAPHRLLVAGEAIDPGMWQELAEQSEGKQIFNIYGPTECCVDATACQVRGGSSARPVIGKPLANYEVYVLDEWQRVVPVSIPGELCIGGAGLARGYHGRAELTAERFIPHPYSRQGGARLYRTGDLGRYLADGSIEYLGRIDRQVKMRGFRIELGEIEATLNEHASVSQAVVVVRDDPAVGQHLVAYIVPKTDHEWVEEASAEISIQEESRLRAYTKEKLPEYMVPSSFVLLRNLPLTSEGKIDYRALPAPDRKNLRPVGTYIPARDTLELSLVQLWEELLNREPIGVDDNFFEVGGHSLLAARMMAAVEHLSGIKLPLSIIFQEPTIERLCRVLRGLPGAVPKFSSLVKIQSGVSPMPFFCVHPAGGHVLCYAPLSRHLGADQTFYGLQAQGLEGEYDPLNSINEMATHYIDVMRGVQPEGPYLLGGWSMGGVVAYEMARQLHKQGHEIALLALLDSDLPASGKHFEELNELTLLEDFARDLGIPPEQLEISPEELMRIELEERLDYILHRALHYDLLPPHIELSKIRHLFDIFKINVRAMLSYVPEPTPVTVTLFKTGGHFDDDGNTIWNTLSPTHVYPVTGNHFTMMKEPHVEVLARKLKMCLDAAFSRQWMHQGAATTEANQQVVIG